VASVVEGGDIPLAASVKNMPPAPQAGGNEIEAPATLEVTTPAAPQAGGDEMEELEAP
jgi:hypothetical protein